VSIKYFSISTLLEVSKSGFWNLIIRIGQLLIDGLDLLVSNFFLGAFVMGTFALSKTIPAVVISLVATLVYVFSPNFTVLYAQNKIDDLKNAVKNSIKILGIFINIPIALLLIYGKEFYSLWLPNTDTETIYLLSSLSLSTIVISGSLNSLYAIFTVTNKLIVNSIAVIFFGFLGFTLSILLLNFTELGVFSIVIASGIVGILRNLIITIPLSAKYLGLKWDTFYIDLFKSLIVFLIALIVGLSTRTVIGVNSWLTLFINFGITSIISLIINYFIILSKVDRKYFISFLLKRKENIYHE
jgi:O-antigen/teichoic acid export membrane protein